MTVGKGRPESGIPNPALPQGKMMDSIRSRGRPAKLGNHRLFPFRLPADLHKELRHFAIDQERSLNEILVEVVRDWWRTGPDKGTVKR